MAANGEAGPQLPNSRASRRVNRTSSTGHPRIPLTALRRVVTKRRVAENCLFHPAEFSHGLLVRRARVNTQPAGSEDAGITFDVR
jgi:hypothetical protein